MLTKIITIYDAEDFPIEVELTAEGHVANDGIGSYEYWGCKGYDSGTDYFEIEEITYEKKEYSEEQQKIIDQYLIDNSEEISEIFNNEWNNQEPYYGYDD